MSQLSFLLLALAAPGDVRGPRDLVLDPLERWIFTANEVASSVSQVEIATGEVVAEVPLAPRSRPRALALLALPDGSVRVAVSESHVHSVAVLRVSGSTPDAPPRLALERRVPSGRRPAGLVLDSASGCLLVACEGEGEVWQIDPDGKEPTRRFQAPEGARRIALIPAGPEAAGRRLCAVAGRTQIALVDLVSGETAARRAIADGTARNLEGLVAADGLLLVTHQIQPTEAPIDPQMIDWGLILANRVTVLRVEDLLRGAGEESTIALDLRNRAAGDPGSPALVPGRDLFLVPSAGTDRLLLVRPRRALGETAVPLASYERAPSVAVGDRPTAVQVGRDGLMAYVACALDDTIRAVDLESREAVRTLRLGPPPQETAELRGARIFYDADRSREGWYSCHSCHPDGGTAGHNFNTQSDGRGLAKRTPALHGVEKTGPWAWVARFDSLQAQVAASLQKTMAVDHPPPQGDVEDVLAFLRTLEPPLALRAGEELGGEIQRGQEIFERAGCSGCHTPPLYTSAAVKDIGLDPAFDGVRKLNPPSLLGVRDRYRYLHDGRAGSLEAVFLEHNPRGQHGEAGELNRTELAHLMAFLRSL